jgi:hypothetical protein
MDILAPVILDGYAPRKDGSFSLRFVTQEQTPEQVANIHAALGSYGFIAFKKEQPLSPSEMQMIADVDLPDNERKTQSQRMRGIIYLLFKADPAGFSSFEDFYRYRTEKIIDALKKQLDNLEV